MRKWLIKIRNELGYKQANITQILGVSQGYYSKIESNIKTPSVQTAKKIAGLLQFDWILFYQELEKDKE